MTRFQNTSQILNRPYRGDEDFWRVRRLILETVATTQLDFNWDLRRWDGWRFYSPDSACNHRRPSRAQLWETETGHLVGAALSEGPGDLHLQLDPGFRELEEEMLTWAEENLSTTSDDGKTRTLLIMVFDYDTRRLELIRKRGFEITEMGGNSRRLRFGEQSLPERRDLPAGYRMRNTRPGDADNQRLADLLNTAFKRDFHVAAESATFAGHAPCFRRELDLVAEAPDGSFGSYVGCAWDGVNKRGIFEPVCTHPEHLRLGLAQTLMFETIHRLADLGAVDITVGTGTAEAANGLYDSIGFTEVSRGRYWRKLMPAN